MFRVMSDTHGQLLEVCTFLHVWPIVGAWCRLVVWQSLLECSGVSRVFLSMFGVILDTSGQILEVCKNLHVWHILHAWCHVLPCYAAWVVLSGWIDWKTINSAAESASHPSMLRWAAGLCIVLQVSLCYNFSMWADILDVIGLKWSYQYLWHYAQAYGSPEHRWVRSIFRYIFYHNFMVQSTLRSWANMQIFGSTGLD